MSEPPSDNHIAEGGLPDEPQNENGLRAFAAIGTYLEEKDWKPQRMQGRTTYRMPFFGGSGMMQCYVQVRVDAEQVIVYVMAPVRVPEERRPAAAEFVTRANYGLFVGNFELDVNDGEVRFKNSVDFEDVPFDIELFRNVFYPALRLTDRYLPGLMKITYGGVEPAEAIAEIEQS